MQNLKTVDFGVAFTLTRPAPADYEDKDGNTQTAAANEPRFNYSNGVAQGLLLDASLSETAAIDDVPAFNASSGHWIIDAEFYNSEPLKGMGLDERFSGSGKMVVSYSGGTAKVWAGGQAVYTVASYTPVEPTHICEGGMVTIAGLTYKPSAISDADAAALATGDFEIYVPFSPSQLFSEGQQGAWYDPSDLSTLFQDSAGTTPVTADGDPVGLMLDKSGNDNHATQSISASRPIYRTDGTLHWLEFDGVSSHLQTPLIDATLSGQVSLFSAVQYFYSPTAILFEFSPDRSSSIGSFSAAANNETINGSINFGINGGTEHVLRPGGIPNAFTRPHVLTFRGDIPGDFIAMRNGGAVFDNATTDLGTSNFGIYKLNIGRRSNGDFPAIMDFYGAAMSFDLPDTSAPESYLADLAGVTL